jgi:transcriptional regulator with XRE-family HTH domain
MAHRAQVSYDTLMNWYAGRTTPRPNELKKVADAIGVRLVDLMDAYEGREPEPPTLVDAIWALVDELRAARLAGRNGSDSGSGSL